jgi:CheY-like chemotaxis protein
MRIRKQSVTKDSNTPARPQVLHIEDDLSVARSISRALRVNGYEVVSVATGDEAIQCIENGFRPSLILTDFHLGLGLCAGDEVVTAIATLLRFKPPVILLTGSPSRHIGAVKSFADRLLAKPVDIDVLLREIENLLRVPR